MSKLNSSIIVWTIFSSLLVVVSAKTCTKELLISYRLFKMNSYTQMLTPSVNTRRTIVITCCEGYREISRRGTIPNCVPICEPPCGEGTCYGPNLCDCHLNYTQSVLGPCMLEEATATVPSTTRSAPNCEPPCGNGTCYGQNRCACNLHFIHSNIGTCVPVPVETTTQNRPTSSAVETKIQINSKEYPQTTTKTNPEETTTKSETTSFIPRVKTTLSHRYHVIRPTTVNKCGPCLGGTCLSETCLCPGGFKLSPEGICQPMCSESCLNGRCIAPNHCECLNGYSFDSQSQHCKPLCNGKIYGCIRGTCVGYNQCRCDNGTLLSKDELFHCIDSEFLQQDQMNWRWSLLLLVVPLAAIVISFYIICKRWRKIKTHRMEAQEEIFTEIRYNNSENEHSVTEKHQQARKLDRYPAE